MPLKQFQAESKRLLDLMVNSIYTHKEIFLRELISNASDAIDKIYYQALTDDSLTFNRNDYHIKIEVDKEKRELKIADTGMGMTRQELEDNLGVIAKSGSMAFKTAHEVQDGYDIIGQFGVGFYSAFMVADRVTVISRALGSHEAYRWESLGAEGYTIEPHDKESVGTEIILKIKTNTEDEDYDQYLEEYRLRSVIKQYSDFIRYPIRMNIRTSRLKEGSEDEYEEVVEEQTINSMVPIWKKNKSELTREAYENFYMEKHYGYDKPLKYIHISAEGAVSYQAILYIPPQMPFDFYTADYEKGLELYANGVLIMTKCGDLLPDYFSFVKGMVDSEDLSLNISREMLQHDRQLKVIAKNLRTKIKSELEDLLRKERESYEKFYQAFGRQLKYGVYSDFGMNIELLQDLIMFYSSTEKKLVTLEEYVSRMPEEQKYIFYAAGTSVERIAKMPQTELVADKGYEILFFTDDVDEFAMQMMRSYRDKEFKSVSSGDLNLDPEEEAVSDEEQHRGLFDGMKEILGEKVSAVRASKRLKNHPVCLANDGQLSIEMEKIINSMPNDMSIKADKILEINPHHQVFAVLTDVFQKDPEKLRLYTNLLYNQALLIEGLPIDDPVEFSEQICKVMI